MYVRACKHVCVCVCSYVSSYFLRGAKSIKFVILYSKSVQKELRAFERYIFEKSTFFGIFLGFLDPFFLLQKWTFLGEGMAAIFEMKGLDCS
jgi:hypothetical protein